MFLRLPMTLYASQLTRLLAGRGVAADNVKFRPVREGVSTDSLKFHPAPPCPTLIRPAGGPPPLTAVWGWPVAVFFPLGYPFLYGPGEIHLHS
jgi:hypothetical protein